MAIESTHVFCVLQLQWKPSTLDFDSMSVLCVFILVEQKFETNAQTLRLSLCWLCIETIWVGAQRGKKQRIEGFKIVNLIGKKKESV